jgi:DNA-binding NtrC family response regulator
LKSEDCAKGGHYLAYHMMAVSYGVRAPTTGERTVCHNRTCYAELAWGRSVGLWLAAEWAESQHCAGNAHRCPAPPTMTPVPRTILLIDDDPAVLKALERFFRAADWSVVRASDGEVALDRCGSERIDLILQDFDLPGIAGMELLKALLSSAPEIPVVVLTGHGDIPLAVAAMQAGAEGFLSKPPDLEYLAILADRVYEKGVLRRENRRLSGIQPRQSALDMLDQSPRLRPLADQIRAVAGSQSTVLLQGETGTGKGWVSRLIHTLSHRSAKSFVEVNCAGLSAALLESELFGHEKGAFTGATDVKDGLFSAADHGTLFLDEIGDLEPGLQPKLLKAIESNQIRRVGGTETITVDVRIIAATNRPLEEEVKEGRFREDLYYRLAVYPLHLPPVRERGASQIVSLAYDLLKGLTGRAGHGPYRISTEALELLAAHPWPGNIRELRNVLERGLITARGSKEIRPEHLTLDLQGSQPGGMATDPTVSLAEVERRHILRVLEHFDGNRSAAARSLGIGRRTLYDKLARYSR